MKPTEDSKNRTETGQWNRTVRSSRPAKSHQDYWKTRLKRRSYVSPDGRRIEIPEWHVRLFFRGHEGWFNLRTANQAAAAIMARDIYLSLVSVGWEATLARFKPDPVKPDAVCTVGEFLANVKKHSHLKPVTQRRYAVKLRKMVVDVANLEAGIKAKTLKAKYDYVNGGRAAWLAKVDRQRLDVLNPDSVNAWRNRYVAKAGTDPVARKSAERSAASYLRCARALFAPDVVKVLKVKLPGNPFAGVKLKDPGPQRYHSEVNPEWLLNCAERELRIRQPQVYLSLSLCLWAGLRRKEADLLQWEQVDFEAGQIHIRRTAYFEPKSEESVRDIDLAPTALNVLRSFKVGSQSEFVLVGSDPNPDATYDYYRCNHTWDAQIEWLRRKGVHAKKANHAIRKESGSIVASTFGIEAARQHLGHRDIRTTSAHYVDKKKRIEVDLSLGSDANLRVVES
jgi:integrase